MKAADITEERRARVFYKLLIEPSGRRRKYDALEDALEGDVSHSSRVLLDVSGNRPPCRGPVLHSPFSTARLPPPFRFR
jgi:hypothetical protein